MENRIIKPDLHLIAIQALDKIAYPIAYLQNDAKEKGCNLDGVAANQLAENPAWLRNIAITALSDISAAHQFNKVEKSFAPCENCKRYEECKSENVCLTDFEKHG